MAKRRKKNPGFEDLISDVDDYVRSSSSAIDLTYEQRESDARDIKALEKIKRDMAKAKKPFPKEAGSRLRELKINLREHDRKIGTYNRAIVSLLEERVKRLEASPLAEIDTYKGPIRQLKFNISKIKAKGKAAGSDVRMDIAEAMGSMLTLEQDLSPRFKERYTMSTSERKMANLVENVKVIDKRWKEIRKHARKHPRLYIHGSDIRHKSHGSGRVVEYDGRRVKFAPDDGRAHITATMDKVIPADVAWIDGQIAGFAQRMRVGEELTKQDLERVIRRINKVHLLTKPRARIRTYAEAKRSLGALIGKIQARLAGDKMDKAEAEKMLLELEDTQQRISSADKATWAKTDQRQWASDVAKVRKAIKKSTRKNNPCIGFHFHGKDADELLKALEGSAKRQQKAVKGRKSNPGNPEAFKRAGFPSSGKVTDVLYSERAPYGPPVKRGHIRIMVDMKVPKYEEYDIAKAAIADCIEETTGTRPKHVMDDGNRVHWDIPRSALIKSNPKKKATKKKVAKKKAARRSPNSAAALTAKCRKLWDHYCERPSKTRLKPVLEHLEKMKASKAKSVKEERSACLRIANKEARRLKMK
jgi:hypothetical protein